VAPEREPAGAAGHEGSRRDVGDGEVLAGVLVDERGQS
jgi:hypothetical protein